MDISDTDFETWFDTLCMLLLDESINFKDADSVRADFEAGKNVFDVADEIAAEY